MDVSEPPPPWRNSHAKHVLQADIENGIVTPDMKPRQVYQMRTLYQLYNKTNFANNLRTLRKEIAFRTNQSAYAENALRDDLAVVNRCTATATSHTGRTAEVQQAPVRRAWGAAVQAQLEADVTAGLHLQMQPKELHAYRRCYQAYPLKVFRGHIHQEEKRRKYVNYRKQKSQKAAVRRALAADAALLGQP